MNAKYELEMLALKSEEIDSLYEELERVRTISKGMGDSEITSLKDQINKTITEYLQDRAVIVNAIMCLEGPAIRRQTIYQRYVKGKTIKTIAKETHYDVGYIRHQCANGITEIAQYLNE